MITSELFVIEIFGLLEINRREDNLPRQCQSIIKSIPTSVGPFHQGLFFNTGRTVCAWDETNSIRDEST